MPNNDFNDIETQARDLAKAANPNLSPETLDRLGKIAGEQSSEILKGLDIRDKSTCGRLTMLFKDQAEDPYGLLSIQIDAMGKIKMSEAYNPGSGIAGAEIRDMEKGEIGPAIKQGTAQIIVKAAPNCKL